MTPRTLYFLTGTLALPDGGRRSIHRFYIRKPPASVLSAGAALSQTETGLLLYDRARTGCPSARSALLAAEAARHPAPGAPWLRYRFNTRTGQLTPLDRL